MQASMGLPAGGRRVSAILLAAILFWNVGSAYAMTVDAPLLSQYIHTNYRQQGIKNVLDVVQDRDGFIWLGTYNGLYRYDGVRFENFSLRTRADFPTNNVKSLAVDAEGAIWIGTSDIGLARFRNDRFEVFGVEQGLPNISVRRLYIDSQHRLWVGTSAGLGLFSNGRFVAIVDEPGLKGGSSMPSARMRAATFG